MEHAPQQGSEPSAHAAMRAPRLGTRGIATLALCTASGTALTVAGLAHAEPDLALAIAVPLGTLLGGLASYVLPAIALALLAWPPFLPGLRLWLARVRDRMSVDQGPMLTAQDRLRHFETAPDHVTVGLAQLRLGQAGKAIPHFGRALQLEPTHVAARFHLGRALLQVGALDKARLALADVVRIDPAHAFGRALLELAEACERTGDDATAERILADHERSHGPHRRADLARGRLALQRGDREAARVFLDRAAAPPGAGTRRLTPDEAFDRARARVLRWRIAGGAA
ncbi:MAG: tetratricopeptide repeat protein [Planctomycetota bacterium]